MLLFSLRKALEKIVARQLGLILLKYWIMTSFYFEAIIDSSAVDVAMTFTHHVEKAFNWKCIITALEFDIKEAFDRIIGKQIIQLLYETNILLPLIHWVAMILADWSTTMKLDGHIKN